MDDKCHRCGKETTDLMPCPYYHMNCPIDDDDTESGPWCCDIECAGECAWEI